MSTRKCAPNDTESKHAPVNYSEAGYMTNPSSPLIHFPTPLNYTLRVAFHNDLYIPPEYRIIHWKQKFDISSLALP